MDWQSRKISPTRETPPRVLIRYPCPGLCRFFGMVGFLVVSFIAFYGGIAEFGLEPIDWAAPAWTWKHFALIAIAVVLGGMASLVGFGLALTIKVRSERLSDLFIVLWQHLANVTVLWVVAVGLAMTLALGQNQAHAAIIDFGAERATIHALGTGGLLGVLLGLALYLAPIIRLPFLLYLAFSVGVSLLAARWHFAVYGIQSHWWVAAGILVPILSLLVAPPMIERDRRQRRLAMEESP